MLETVTIDPTSLREAFRRHAQGVTIVTTVDQFGNQWGMTATAVSSVSLDPPLLMVCIDNRSPLTGPLSAGAGFVVHVLTAAQDELARHFASPLEDKLDGVRHSFARNGCARLNDALASLECATDAVHPAGDHTIYIGRVTTVVMGDAAEGSLVFFDGRLTGLVS